MIFILVITHDAYQYIYRYDGLPEFLSWLSKEIENEFPEKHYVLVDTYVDPEGGDESLHAYILDWKNMMTVVMNELRQYEDQLNIAMKIHCAIGISC